MSGPQFFQTVMGQRFLEGTMPKIARALERIADALEAHNKTAPEAEPAYVLVEVKDGVAEVTRTSGKVEKANPEQVAEDLGLEYVPPGLKRFDPQTGYYVA